MKQDMEIDLGFENGVGLYGCVRVLEDMRVLM